MFDDAPPPTPPDELAPALESGVARAAAAWQRGRLVRGGLDGLGAGLATAAVLTFGVELASDLDAAWLPALLAPAALGAALGLARHARRPSDAAAAAEWDQRAGLDERVGTALEFRDSALPLVPTQRADAADAIAGLDPARSFPLEARPPALRAALAGLALLLVLAFAAFRVPPRAEPTDPEPVGAGDVLHSLLDEALAPTAPALRPASARLLRELRAQVRAVQQAQRRVRPKPGDVKPKEPEPATPSQTVAPPPPPPTAPPRAMTAADLLRLEEAANSAMLGATTAEQQMVQQLFDQTRRSQQLLEQFHELVEREEEASSPPPSRGGIQGPPGSSMNDKMNRDMIGKGALSERLGDMPDEKKREDMIRQDLGKEAQAEHDMEHALQAQFQEFMKEIVKDVQDAVKKAALGKRDKKDKGVSMKGGATMDDKRDEMDRSGFRDADRPPDAKGKDGGPPGEMKGPGDADGEAAAKDGPQSTPPPDMELQAGAPPQGSEPGSGPVAGPGTGTSAGAQGAGTGGPDAAETRRDVPLGGGGSQLERLLGELGRGGLPGERKEQLWNRLARHKVEGNAPQSEGDDVLLDYFGDAEEDLLENEENLPPTLAAYARSYLDSIRPRRTSPPEP